MIERSHRRKLPQAKPDPDMLLKLHERIASQRLWFFRLLIASSIALVLSFVLWLAGVAFVWHVLGIAVGFVVGLFVQRSMNSWALAWIRERAGLSYETALEQQHLEQNRSQQNQKDDFGFTSSLKERAAQEASRLTLPKYQAWWLPMLAVALALAFLPLIPSLPNLPTQLTPPPTSTPLPEMSNQPANSVEPTEPQTAAQPIAEPPQTTDAPSQNSGETDTSQLDNATGSSQSSSNAQSADEQALDRFLENLRENEQSQEGAPDVDLSSVMQPGDPGNRQPLDEDNASRPRSEQTNPFSQAGENQPSEAQQDQQAQSEESQAGEGEQGQGEEGQDQGQQAQAQPEEGQSESEEGSQSAGAESQEGTGQAAQQGEGEQQAQGEQGQAGAGESDGSAQSESADRGSSDSGENADGAGSSPGSPTAQSTEVIGESEQSPEFLSGDISEGPNNIAGTARLPGETEEVVFPQGSAPGSFSRAEEEALTEGRIPLEYQEVIRRYFRGDGQ